MAAQLRVDRDFLFLKKNPLATFTERILRNTHTNVNFADAAPILEALEQAVQQLKKNMRDPFLRRKDKLPAIKEQEIILLKKLDDLANFVEQRISTKSDILSTGFHLHAESKSLTRRQSRLDARIKKIGL